MRLLEVSGKSLSLTGQFVYCFNVNCKMKFSAFFPFLISLSTRKAWVCQAICD